MMGGWQSIRPRARWGYHHCYAFAFITFSSAATEQRWPPTTAVASWRSYSACEDRHQGLVIVKIDNHLARTVQLYSFSHSNNWTGGFLRPKRFFYTTHTTIYLPTVFRSLLFGLTNTFLLLLILPLRLQFMWGALTQRLSGCP